MIPIFFPFTCISSEIVNILHTVFGQIAVYQASKKTVPKSMKDLAADGCLEIRFPVTAQEKELQTLFKQYHIWSDVHQISDKRYLIQREKDPADYTPSKIRTEIKRRLRGEPIEGKSRIIKGTIDLGNDDQRDVIIGGAQYFQPEEIVGKTVIVLANLEPKKMAGVESNAMLLAADVDDKPFWLTVTEDVPLGSPIK